MKNGVLTHEDHWSIFAVLMLLVVFAGQKTAAFLGALSGARDVQKTLGVVPFAVHFVGCVHGTFFKTEKFFDLSFAVSYLIVNAYALWESKKRPRHALLFSMVLIWTLRLGSFLFLRILRRGSDFRHAGFKNVVFGNTFVWACQALWVVWTYLGFALTMSADAQRDLDLVDAAGAGVFAFGLWLEHTADFQKTEWLKTHDPNKEWIDTGLWKNCRHPNYGGETLVWVGITLLCLNGVQTVEQMLVCAISPIFAAWFLFATSVRLLKIRLDSKFANDPAYERRLKTTTIMFPLAF